MPDSPLAALPPARLRRRRLLDLDQGQPVLVIEAPAGYGKSVLARQWLALARPGTTTAWIALDTAARDPAILLERLLAAFEPPAAGRSTAAGRKRPVAERFEQLCRQLPERDGEVRLVIDDGHALVGSDSAFWLARLLELASPRLRFCLTTQALRLGVGLGRLAARGSVLWIPSSRLAFTCDEIAALARLRGGRAPAPAQLEALHAATEGWPALVQLALSTPVLPEGGSALAASSAVGDYLCERFLDALDEAERDLLWLITCLGRAPLPLLAGIAPTADVDAGLRRLRAMGIVQADEGRDGTGLRLQGLLRAAVIAHLPASPTRDRNQVLRAAAEWYWQQGQGVDAIRTALEAGGALQEQARRWLSGFGLDLVFRMGQHQTLLDLVAAWEAIASARCPAIDAVAAWALVFQRRFAPALERIDRLAVADHAEHRSSAQLQRAVLAGLRDQHDECSHLAQAWIRQHDGAHGFGMAVASTVSAFSYKCAGEPNAAQAALREACHSFNLAQSAYGLGWVDVVGALSLVHTGRYREALAQLETGLQRCPGEQGFGITRALLRAIEAYVRYERGELAAVQELLGDVLGLLAEQGVVDAIALGYTAAARLRASGGDFGAALDLLSEAEQIGLRRELPRLVSLMQAERALLLLRAGSTLRARALLDAMPARDGATAAIRLLQARLAIAEGDPVAAVALLDLIEVEARVDHRLLLQCEALLLRAQADDLRGEEAPALAAFGAALGLAGSEGYARTLIDDRRRLASLARRWLAAGAEPAAAAGRQLALQLAAGAGALPAEPLAAGLGPGTDIVLSARQREILSLLNQGLSNSQLAKRCLLSESTVKWYLHNLYESFGAANRTALLRAVREQGLGL